MPGTFDPPAAALLQAAASADVVSMPPQQPHRHAAARGAYRSAAGRLEIGASLVVDEAFIDLALEAAPLTLLLQRYPALILLRP